MNIGSTCARPWFVLGLGLFLAIPCATNGQQLGDMDSLSKAFEQNPQRRKELFDGTTQPGAADKKFAEAAAQWYVYRITHKTVLGNPVLLARVYTDLDNAVKNAMDKDRQVKNRAFMNLFSGALVASMKEALAANININPTVVVHAGMMLPTMAKLKQDSISDYLMGLVSDEKSEDVIRLYALKGLKETMPIRTQLEEEDFTDKAFVARKNRDVKAVETLTKYIERPVKIDGLPYEEVEAIRYLRREAIISLAHAGAPAVLALKKPEKKEGLLAPTLLRVLSKDGLEPPASLQEKIEAALGLCAMKYPNMPEYEPAVAIYLIGRTLDEVIGEYKLDYKNFVAAGAGRKLPRIAWKTESKRLDAGLKELAENGKGTNAKQAAEKLKSQASPILTAIYQYNVQLNDLPFRNDTVPGLKPKTGYPFKSLKTPEIPLD